MFWAFWFLKSFISFQKKILASEDQNYKSSSTYHFIITILSHAPVFYLKFNFYHLLIFIFPQFQSNPKNQNPTRFSVKKGTKFSEFIGLLGIFNNNLTNLKTLQINLSLWNYRETFSFDFSRDHLHFILPSILCGFWGKRLSIHISSHFISS